LLHPAEVEWAWEEGWMPVMMNCATIRGQKGEENVTPTQKCHSQQRDVIFDASFF